MNYRVRRIDPYWMKNPILPVIAIVGVIAGIALISRGMAAGAIVGGVIAGVAIILSTQPAISALMGVLGLLGGITTFLIYPRSDVADMSIQMRLLSTVLFALFYTVLMDGVVLFVAVLYNLFAGALGLDGLSVELDADGSEAGE
jgi:hypothetical protein